ncbi:unnamed protein product, partial [Iphiclides podalirius]
MAYEGKLYKHVRDENFEAFVKSLNLPEEHTTGFLNFKPDQKLEKNGDSYTLTTISGNNTKEVTFKNGVEFDETVVPGRVSKTTITLSGNTLTQVQKFDDGNVITTKREYSGDGLTVTLQRNNVDGPAGIRHYKA